MKQSLKMKPIPEIRKKFWMLFCLLASIAYSASLIGQQDSTKPETSVIIHHFVVNNSFQYLMVETKIKVDKRWQPFKGQLVQLYLDSTGQENLISEMRTDSAGKAKSIIPDRLKALWDLKPDHKFIAVTNGEPTEINITKAKIFIDTLNIDGARNVSVQITKWDNGSWLPAKDVEVKIGVKRLGGELKVGEEESYTTDSLGVATAEFKLDSLSSDKKGNLILVAKVEDNDEYGSLSIEKSVPWGTYHPYQTVFGKRALWGPRGKAPAWLIFVAYSTIAAVWGTIFLLILRLGRIIKLGKEKVEEVPHQKMAEV